MVRDDALLFVRLAEQHRASGERERRRAADEGRRHDMRARLERTHVLGEGGGGLGFGHATE